MIKVITMPSKPKKPRMLRKSSLVISKVSNATKEVKRERTSRVSSATRISEIPCLSIMVSHQGEVSRTTQSPPAKEYLKPRRLLGEKINKIIAL